MTSTFLPCVLVVLATAGCAVKHHNVLTNKDPAYAAPLDRVLVAVSTGASPRDTEAQQFEQALVEAMQRNLNAACVQTAIARPVGGAAANEEALRQAVSAFSPTQVLEVSPLSFGYRKQDRTKLAQGEWKFALTDVRQNRVVWRAEAFCDLLVPRYSRIIADEITEKLRAEGLLAHRCTVQ